MAVVLEARPRTGNPEQVIIQPYDTIVTFAQTSLGLPKDAEGKVIAQIKLTTQELEQLLTPHFERNRIGGVEISFYSPNDQTFPNGMWIGLFDPHSTGKYFPMYPKGCTALVPNGEVLLNQLSGFKLDSMAINMSQITAQVVAAAIRQGRAKPFDPATAQALQGRI